MRVFNLTEEKYEYLNIDGEFKYHIGDTLYGKDTKEYYVIINHNTILSEARYAQVEQASKKACVVEVSFTKNGKIYYYWTQLGTVTPHSKATIKDNSGKFVEVFIHNIKSFKDHLKNEVNKPTKVLPLSWRHSYEPQPTSPTYYAVVRFYQDNNEIYDKDYTYKISIQNYHEILLAKNRSNWTLMPNNKKVSIIRIGKTSSVEANEMREKTLIRIKFEEENNNNKEKKDMNMNFDGMFKNIKFGKVNSNALKFSLAGVAFRGSDGDYCTYDIETNELTNVNGFTIDGAYLYEMPVAVNEVKVGDVISTRGSMPYVVVKEVTESGSFKCVMPTTGVVSEILPEKNMFGFNFVTKVFNPFGNMVKPSKSNPFGDMNSLMPLMLMDKDSDNNDFFKAYMMMNMMQGNNENFNPMMMMLAMRD